VQLTRRELLEMAAWFGDRGRKGPAKAGHYRNPSIA
jgi:hypothetical protein